MHLVNRHFPELSKSQYAKLKSLEAFYLDWNQKINVISRKDMGSFYLKHVLHSLSIGKYFSFTKKDIVLDIGSGGGFPGIPLSILFSQTKFILVDSILKKTKVLEDITSRLAMNNVIVLNQRVENIDIPFTHVCCRAVAPLSKLDSWVQQAKARNKNTGAIEYLFLKGGILKEEIREYSAQKNRKPQKLNMIKIREYIDEPFFTDKYIIHIKCDD